MGLYLDDAYIGNYGDNALLYFHQYQQRPRLAVPLAQRAPHRHRRVDLAGQGFFDQS